jgi:hypothetical protein
MAAPEPGWAGGPLYMPAEILARPCPIPATAGVYGWLFATIPPGIDAGGTVERDASRLLYVVISPGRPTSSQTLRSRLRAHCRGDAYGSTLPLTVGCLLADELGIELRRIGGGARETFGAGEAVLSEWIARNMRVSFREDDEPWVAEAAIIGALDLPLNIEQNAHDPQRDFVRELHRRCKDHARRLSRDD